jgi:Flp pilus assembly protein TadB
MLTNRDYSSWFLATDQGHTMIGYAIASQIGGIWCMRQITRAQY